MKKLFSFVLGLLLFFCPIAVQAEDFEPRSQEEIPPNVIAEILRDYADRLD